MSSSSVFDSWAVNSFWCSRKGRLVVVFPDKATPNKTQSTCLCAMGTENLSVVHMSLYSLHFMPCGKIKCLNFLSWWWWEYCMRSLKNTSSFFGSTYVKSFGQVICSKNLKIGQCLCNTFFVNWMSGCLVLLAVSMPEMSWKESEDPEGQGQISSLYQFDCDCINVVAFLSGITNCHLLLQILHPDLKWLHLALRDDRFLRKSWFYVCGGQYCSSPTILVWNTSGKTVSLLFHLDSFHLFLLLWTT